MPIRNQNFAILAVAAALPCVAGRAQTFTAVPAPQGLPSVFWSTSNYGSGMAVADFDGDGDVDIVIPVGATLPTRMFRNDGGMTFTDVTAAAGLGSHLAPHAVQAADVDNDGDQDLYVGGSSTPAQLFINDGTGVFTEQAAARGLVHSDDNYSVSFGDFDRDGWLDLYLANRHAPGGVLPGPNRLYRNTGNGHFVDVTAAAGVAGNSLTLVAIFMDFDEDGWPDIFEVSEKPTIQPNELYRNNGNGTFTPVAAQIGANVMIRGMGIDIADAFNDGGVDFYCTDGPPDHLFQVWDPALQRYVVATSTYGLQGGGVGWGCNFLDVNNDGWQDLYVVHESSPNMLFRNPGTAAALGVPWTNQAAAAGLAQSFSQFTVSVADFDDDGNLDLLQRFHSGGPLAPNGVALYRNGGTVNRWLKFRTVGRTSNRDGIGARIDVRTGTMVQRQYVRSGVGYLGGSDLRVHFGIGHAQFADAVTVTWPSGQRQHLRDVAANQIVELREPTLSSSGPVAVGGTATVTASIPGDEGLPYMLLLSLSANTGIPLGNEILPIDFDVLTSMTLDPANPFFVGSAGLVAPNGEATATLFVPPLPFLSGFTLYAAGLTIDSATSPVARTVLRRNVAIPIL